MSFEIIALSIFIVSLFLATAFFLGYALGCKDTAKAFGVTGDHYETEIF